MDGWRLLYYRECGQKQARLLAQHLKSVLCHHTGRTTARHGALLFRLHPFLRSRIRGTTLATLSAVPVMEITSMSRPSEALMMSVRLDAAVATPSLVEVVAASKSMPAQVARSRGWRRAWPDPAAGTGPHGRTTRWLTVDLAVSTQMAVRLGDVMARQQSQQHSNKLQHESHSPLRSRSHLEPYDLEEPEEPPHR